MTKTTQYDVSNEVRELLSTPYEGEDDVAEDDNPETNGDVKPSGLSEKSDPRTGFLGWKMGDETPRSARHPNPRIQAQRVNVMDMTSTGHGFKVEKVSRAWELPRHCRQCGDLLPIPGVDYDICQFQDQPWERCQCSPCLERRYRLKRNRGRQPVHCGSPECSKAENRERQRLYRQRRKAEQLMAA